MKPCVISGNLIEDVGRWGKFFEAKEELVSVLRVLVKIYDCSAKRARQLPRFAAIWISIVYSLIAI